MFDQSISSSVIPDKTLAIVLPAIVPSIKPLVILDVILLVEPDASKDISSPVKLSINLPQSTNKSFTSSPISAISVIDSEIFFKPVLSVSFICLLRFLKLSVTKSDFLSISDKSFFMSLRPLLLVFLAVLLRSVKLSCTCSAFLFTSVKSSIRLLMPLLVDLFFPSSSKESLTISSFFIRSEISPVILIFTSLLLTFRSHSFQ